MQSFCCALCVNTVSTCFTPKPILQWRNTLVKLAPSTVNKSSQSKENRTSSSSLPHMLVSCHFPCQRLEVYPQCAGADNKDTLLASQLDKLRPLLTERDINVAVIVANQFVCVYFSPHEMQLCYSF